MGTRNLNTNWGRYAVIATLLTGVVLHSTRLVVGVEAFQGIFTPLLDALFSVPIILGIIGMAVTWKYMRFRNRWEKGVVMFTVFYFTASMPLHLKTWFVGNTDYIAATPWWYGIVFLSYTSILLFVWWRLEIVAADTMTNA